MKKILIVDDDINYSSSLVKMFEKEYEITNVQDTKRGEIALKEDDFDLVILDYFIGDDTGAAFYELCREYLSNKRVLVLSGAAQAKEIIDMLDKPVMDFIDKATPAEVIYKKVQRFMSDKSLLGESTKLYSEKEELELDIETRVATVRKDIVKLTNKEFMILKMLLEAKDETLDREDIFIAVWGYVPSYENLRLVDVNVLKVRKKLGVKSIFSERGVGYVWREKTE